MKKLTIIFKDDSKIVYTMKNSISWSTYFAQHSLRNIKSATLQQYPKKDNEQVIIF